MNLRTLKRIASVALWATMTLAFFILVTASGKPPAASALPPRYTPTPIAPAPVSKQLRNGYIELQLYSFTYTQMHSVVQWVDGLGVWHDVTGWQDTPANVTDYYESRWWVYPSDYGKGPFRWAIFTAGTVLPATPLAVSQPFTLPLTSNDIVRTQVIIPAR
ncbi:MAG TPA: hypothetical protein VGK81_12300 [Anaerolineae bacterium]